MSNAVPIPVPFLTKPERVTRAGAFQWRRTDDEKHGVDQTPDVSSALLKPMDSGEILDVMFLAQFPKERVR